MSQSSTAPTLASSVCEVSQQYETPLFPTGCIFKIVLLSTHGDRFYLGLNSLELYDENNAEIALNDDNASAVPRDITELEGYEQDPRVLLKLFGRRRQDESHEWLAPFTGPNSAIDQHRSPNTIFLFFDEPRTLSRISIWNYCKTPARGAQEIEVYADDVLVYKGHLRIAPPFPAPKDSADEDDYDAQAAPPLGRRERERAGRKRKSARRRSSGGNGKSASDDDLECEQCILFTNDPAVLHAKKHCVYDPDDVLLDSNVVFIDEGRTLQGAESDDASKLQRPFTAVRRRPQRGEG
mmetsp:Transcript_15242/g.45822  ORF Transcript_15242/g.45822 Transcript_15242/m.45822 type:complete len:295 (-) Transcript_15242:73-957(-)